MSWWAAKLGATWFVSYWIPFKIVATETIITLLSYMLPNLVRQLDKQQAFMKEK